MTTYDDIFGGISGGRVLDVATGAGGFIHILLDNLKDTSAIIGIDTNERFIQVFNESFKDIPKVRFEKMDAGKMDFEDASFNMVCLANSIHHLDPQPVFIEMMRVLKMGGYFVVSEMYCDNQTETQMSHVLLHHWWAAVDRANGIVHRETYQRSEIIKMVSNLGLSRIGWHDVSHLEDDPKSDDILHQLDPAIDRYIQRSEGHPDLQATGEELRQRVREVGFHGATNLIGIGIKDFS
jgi:ubiquinone/menaquinone biosynthesis C-methylase UbiE